MTSNPVDQWTAQLWDDINNAVTIEAGKVRIAQKVFPTVTCDDNPTEVIDDVINFQDLSIQEGKTKPFVEIYREFALSRTQVTNEPTLKTCKTLARMAAKEIALAEDIIFFQGKNGSPKKDGKINQVETENLDSSKEGLLGEAKDFLKQKQLNKVDRAQPPPVEKLHDTRSEDTFASVTAGIAELVDRAQAPPYALFLPTRAYANTYAPQSSYSLVTPADRIKPLVEGGFYGTGTLPDDTGLLVALGGEPTTLYVGREITTEFRREEGSKYIFAVVERIQFVARDVRSLVLLQFESCEQHLGLSTADVKTESVAPAPAS
jgi:uncharacterized linocin/CFP29 family protein